MDETRIERALRQGPPFRTNYVARPLPLGPDIVGRSRAPRAMRLVGLVGLIALVVVAGLAALTVGGFMRPSTPDVTPLTRADYDASTWTELARMSTGRRDHTATLLADGQVLVVGGSTTLNGDGTTSVERYDPATGIWAAVARTIAVHQAHTATLLPDGRVLVAGGADTITIRGSDTAAAEIFDPVTGRWTATSSMSEARPGHTATLLANGEVLVAGGRGATTSAELYDPATGRWHATGEMLDGRANHTATLLLDGRVLVVGGGDASGELGTAELYDPGTGTWSPAAAPPADLIGRPLTFLGHTATRLPDGTVLITGGWHDDNGRIEDRAIVYDPARDTWTMVAALPEARGGHTATLLRDGTVLVVGGIGTGPDSCEVVVKATAERFDPVTGAWSVAPPMPSSRYEHEATALRDGSVLVTGGTDTYCMDDPLASAEIFGPATP
jgi:N-acetylneuraminic acid mutarotase